MPLYELGLILDPEASPEDEAAVLERLETIITEAGGEMVNKDSWGRRKLAYPIRKKNVGVYHFWQYQAPGAVHEPLSFELRTNDVVMRHLILNLDREWKKKHKIERMLKAKAEKKAAAAEAAVTADEAES